MGPLPKALWYISNQIKTVTRIKISTSHLLDIYNFIWRWGDFTYISSSITPQFHYAMANHGGDNCLSCCLHFDWNTLAVSRFCHMGLLTNRVISLILAWIDNHIPSKVRGKITYSLTNVSGSTVEVWKLISYFIPHFIMGVITSPC